MGSPALTLTPPFTEDSALLKVRIAEDLWNSRDPDRALALTRMNPLLLT